MTLSLLRDCDELGFINFEAFHLAFGRPDLSSSSPPQKPHQKPFDVLPLTPNALAALAPGSFQPGQVRFSGQHDY
jgi:hypothetical protein